VRFDVLDVDGAGDDGLQPVRRRVRENVPPILQVANARCILPTRKNWLMHILTVDSERRSAIMALDCQQASLGRLIARPYSEVLRT
jgi:hypothetical protein